MVVDLRIYLFADFAVQIVLVVQKVRGDWSDTHERMQGTRRHHEDRYAYFLEQEEHQEGEVDLSTVMH